LPIVNDRAGRIKPAARTTTPAPAELLVVRSRHAEGAGPGAVL